MGLALYSPPNRFVRHQPIVVTKCKDNALIFITKKKKIIADIYASMKLTPNDVKPKSNTKKLTKSHRNISA